MTAATSEIGQATELEHRFLPVGSIDVSKTNPRKHFDKTKLAELTESIVRHGVLVPVLVRPKGDRFELVAGERRLRAAKDAPIGEIPAIVRELSDKDALEIQVVENLQREDLHPLEEAEGYAQLIRAHGYDADSLALKIGKSRSYVYGRMKLVDLNELTKKALWDGKISHSVALLIARIPDKNLQAQATKAVAHGDDAYYRREMSYREASEYIQQHFMLKLADAPFDRADAQLVVSAGPCTTCPLRTGNQKELFDDVKSADVCTSPSCYRNKVAAYLKIEAEAKGFKSLTAGQAKDAFQHGSPRWGGPFVDVDGQASELGSYTKKYKDVVPKDTPIYLGLDDRGEIHKLYAKRDLPKRKERKSASRTGSPHNYSADNTKWKREQELRDATEAALSAAMVKKITKATKLTEIFPAIVAAIIDDRGWIPDDITKRLALPKRPKKFNSEGIVEWVRELKPEQRVLVCASVLFLDNRYGPDEEPPVTKYFFTALGIDAVAIATKVKTELEAKWAAKKKGAKKKKSS